MNSSNYNYATGFIKWKGGNCLDDMMPDGLRDAMPAMPEGHLQPCDADYTVGHAQYKAYWQRYMIIETLRARGKGRAQVAWARAAGSGQFTELKKECSDYYSAAKLRYPVSTDDGAHAG